jgi:hypothetical protein
VSNAWRPGVSGQQAGGVAMTAAATAGRPGQSIAPEPPPRSTAALKLLVIDDHQPMRQIIRESLYRLGMRNLVTQSSNSSSWVDTRYAK